MVYGISKNLPKYTQLLTEKCQKYHQQFGPKEPPVVFYFEQSSKHVSKFQKGRLVLGQDLEYILKPTKFMNSFPRYVKKTRYFFRSTQHLSTPLVVAPVTGSKKYCFSSIYFIL